VKSWPARAAVQALVGHSSSDVTRLVYLHSLAEDQLWEAISTDIPAAILASIN
jgi:integrase